MEIESPDKSKWRKIDFPLAIKSIIIVLIIVCILSPRIRDKAFNNPLLTNIDTQCTGYLDKNLKNALAAYGVARLTNGLVSVLQSADFGIEAGVAATINPLEVLDPLNDLVERFSWIMLLSIVSISIQEFLIRFFSSSVLFFILLPGLVILLAGLWLNQFSKINMVKIGKQFVFLAIVLRFIIPAEVAVGNRVYTKFLKAEHDEAIAAIKAGNSQLKTHSPVDADNMVNSESYKKEKSDSKKLMDLMTPDIISGTKKTINYLKQLPEKFKQFKIRIEVLAKEMIENFISLIVVFIINTIILPIFTIWLIVYSLRVITGSQAGSSFENKFKVRVFGEK